MLRIGSGSFDPETLVILETAFDEAWITLKTNGSGNIRPDELARRICHLAMEGERDPVRLHDRALLGLIPATIWREVSSATSGEPVVGGRLPNSQRRYGRQASTVAHSPRLKHLYNAGT